MHVSTQNGFYEWVKLFRRGCCFCFTWLWPYYCRYCKWLPGIYMSFGPWLTTPSQMLHRMWSPRKPWLHILFRSSLQIYIQLPTLSSIKTLEKQGTIARLQHFTASSIPTSSRKVIVSEVPFVTASGKYALNGLLGLRVMYPKPKYLIWTEANKHHCR